MTNPNQREDAHGFETRLRLAQYVVFAIFIVLGIRFYALQVARHDEFQQRAENNRIREIPIPAPRGSILDRNLVPLVDNTPAFNVVLAPELIANRDQTIKVLVENLGIEYNQLMAELNVSRPKSQPILVKQNATVADRQWVAAHDYDYPEIGIEPQPQRLYPFGKLAAHVLGYIGEISPKQLEDPKYRGRGYQAGDIIGQGGIEAVYDRILRGVDGKRRVVVDSRGRTIRELDAVEPIRGQDIVTTLDVDVQQVAEEQFDSTNSTGAAIAMNPQNGEILAMVSRPAFDPNVFARNVISAGENRAEVRTIINDPQFPLYNKGTQGIYPAGSTWKLMISTAALEEGVITPASRIACGGGLQVGNRFMHCMGSHGSPEIHAAIVHSCDGFFYRLGLKMGVDMIHNWIVRFGMGQLTGVDLPHEKKCIIPSREWKRRNTPRDPEWKDFDTASAAVGQGSVAITPIALLRAESGIMMGGAYRTPHVLKEAKATQLERAKYFDDAPAELKLSRETVDVLTYGAWGVVNQGGTASGAGFPLELNIGGKTGTAQVIAKEKVRLKEHADHAWFISFAPLHTDQPPELAVVVLTENGGQGGRASAPKAKMINGAYFSKKLGRPVLPELIARGELFPARQDVSAPSIARPAVDADKRRDQ
ncbi:MAG TPA: penicillin-binding protein 2 [Blastocatellia bacterium]|nr:penicillin-binding protein 2 [Blastocatellia bacterium]